MFPNSKSKMALQTKSKYYYYILNTMPHFDERKQIWPRNSFSNRPRRGREDRFKARKTPMPRAIWFQICRRRHPDIWKLTKIEGNGWNLIIDLWWNGNKIGFGKGNKFESKMDTSFIAVDLLQLFNKQHDVKKQSIAITLPSIINMTRVGDDVLYIMKI